VPAASAKPATHDRHGDWNLLLSLLWCYLAAIPIGAACLRRFGLESGWMTLDRAFFWSVNALTGTGFRLSPNGLADFSFPGQLCVYLLMTLGAFCALTAGGLLVVRLAGLPYSRLKVLAAAAGFLILFSGVGTGLLMQEGRSIFAALFQATSAFANAGMTIDPPHRPSQIELLIVVLPFAALGSLGLPVLMELVGSLFGLATRLQYTQSILRWTVAAWLIGFAVLFLCGLDLPPGENLLASWVNAANARGLAADIEFPTALPKATWWVMALLMLVGGAPGSTAGGLKITTIAAVFGETRRLWQNKASQRLAAALLWLAVFLGVFLGLFLLMLCLHPEMTTDQLVVMVAGALSNTGLSLDPITLVGGSLHILTATMLLGHLLPIAFAAFLLSRGSESGPIS
jgi:Trk-type K+ transport system membrane component